MHPFYQSAFTTTARTTNTSEQQGESSATTSNNDSININNHNNNNINSDNNGDDALHDFQEPLAPLKKTGKQLAKGKRSRTDYEDSDDDDQNNDNATECPICLKGVSNQGDHALVVTKCGHTFGEICIMKWILKKQKDKVHPRCPICGQNGPVLKKSDLRRVIVTKLIAHDTSDIERIRKELDEAKRMIGDKTREIMSLKGQIKLLNQSQSSEQLEVLKAKLVALSSEKFNSDSNRLEEEVQEKKILQEFYSYPLEYQQQGRSLAISAMDEMAIISVGNASTGYGLQRISLRDIKSVDYFPNHKKTIRDIKCSPFQQSLILSTGLDSKLALTCVRNKHVIQTYSLEKPGWSCDFDETDSNLLYCGLLNNTVSIYDIRNTKNHLHQLRPPNTPGNFSIHSLAAVNNGAGGGKRLIFCSNNMGSYMWELDTSSATAMGGQEPIFHSLSCTTQEGYKPYSLSFDNGTRTILISARRSTALNNGSTLHSLYHLYQQPEEEFIKPAWSFENPFPQIQLTRTYHFEKGGGSKDLVACFASDKTISLRNHQEDLGSFSVNDPVMDIKAKKVGQDIVVGALTEKTLHLYKYQ
ncbi:WD40-repeat-containing domain protein [Circinella umbellata]|nr:WD40-repeat-containing domain protein [Circinella umbellata]